MEKRKEEMENKRIRQRYFKMVSVLTLWAVTTVLVVGITAMLSGVVWRLFI